MKRAANRILTPSTFWVLVPKSYDPDTILLSKPCRADKKAALKDTMNYILHTLHGLSYQTYYKNEMEENGYSPLHSGLLNKICGKRYKEALQLLVDHGIVECWGNSYQAGKYSKGYRIIPDYISKGTHWVEITTPSIIKQHNGHIEEREVRRLASLASLDHITRWFNPMKLQIDVQKAHYFNEKYRTELEKQHQKVEAKYTLTENQVISSRIVHRYNSAVNTVKKISKGDFNLSRAGKDQRLHSTVSSMKKELRGLITYEGKKLISLDITSSQPYLITQLTKPDFYSDTTSPLSLFHLHPQAHLALTSHPYKNQLERIIMFGTYDNNADYEHLIKGGFQEFDWGTDLYSKLVEFEAGYTTQYPGFPKRSKAKKSMMLILYDKKNGRRNGAETFAGLFPKEADLVKLFNSIPGDNYLPIVLQRLESRLVLDHVCLRISEVLPDAPLIPVHDCILTTEEYADQVRELMIRVLEELTGVKPGIKCEEQDDQEVLAALAVTAEDDFSIIRKSITKLKASGPLKEQGITKLADPVLYEIPKWGDNQILSTRYLDPEFVLGDDFD